MTVHVDELWWFVVAVDDDVDIATPLVVTVQPFGGFL